MSHETLPEPRGYIRARPIRVAFLAANSDHAHLVLDAIFADSFGRWGGRYSLICPCESGFPRASYISWLRSYDPDILYSYIDISDENLRRLRELLGPAYFLRHREDTPADPTQRDFRVAQPIGSLGSLSVTLQYARAFPASAPQPMWIVDYLGGRGDPDRFIDDNFGTHWRSYYRWPIHESMADVTKSLTVVSQADLSRPNTGRRYQGETVEDAAALLHYMAQHRNSYGLAQLSADSAPHIELREGFEDAFTLVVGDSFVDRLHFWNSRSRVPNFLGRDFTTMIVSPARLDNAGFFTALVQFLKARNGVPRQGPPWVQLVSASQSTEQLTALRDRFRQADKWNGYHVSQPITIDSVVPTDKALKHAQHLVAGSWFERRPEWKDFPTTGSATRPPVVVPKHISHMPDRSVATAGAWALDVDIERQNNLSRYSNVRHHWRFPRRLRFVQAFRQSYQSAGPSHEDRHTRASHEGYLVLFTESGEELPTISLPDDETAFRWALQRGDTWPPFQRFDSYPAPTGPFAWARPSDKGRYLTGTLRLFGNLQSAASVLLHSYWRAVFEELGGAIGETRKNQISNALKKKTRHVTTQPSEWTEDIWDRMTALVASEARQVRIPQQSLSFADLRKRHEPYIEMEKLVLAEHDAENPEEWIERASRSVTRSVQELCALKVLFQGYEWRCDTCFNTNWNEIGALTPQLTCVVCGTKKPAPVEKPWNFRLNGFVQDAMREHGLLALVWCLNKLEERARTTFFYLGPHDLWKNFPDDERSKRDNEFDLLCVVDGRVHLCEVKSSARDIELESLVEVARRIRPDVVTLAVMESASPRLTARLQALKTALAGTEIDAELLLVQNEPFSNDAYLPW